MRGRRGTGWALAAMATVGGAVSLHAAEALSPSVPTAAAAALLALTLWHVRERLQDARRTAQRLQALTGAHDLAEELGTLGSWRYDVAADRYDWSAGTFRVFGVEPELGAPSSRGFFICVHVEDQPVWEQALARAIRRGERLDTEFRYVKDGRDTIWVRGVARPAFDRDGKVTHLTGIVQDVTAARRLVEQLAHSEAKFRDLARMSSDWYWETDDTHRLSHLSDSAHASLGDWVQGWLGQRDWELPAADFPRTDWAAHRARLQAREPFERFRFTRLDPDSNLLHLEVTGRPLFDEDGRFRGYRGTGRDVTRERQQRVLLQVETDLAMIIRTQDDPHRAITAMIVKLCATMGWAAGVRLERLASAGAGADAVAVRESWGDAAFTRMLAALPDSIALEPNDVEARSWATGRALWLQDVSTQPSFCARYGCAQLGLAGAFVAPVVDGRGKVLSALMFFSPVGFRADLFVSQVAEALSRTLSLYLQRKGAEQRLLHASLHDPLTDLPNRMHLMRRLQSHLAHTGRAVVLYLDLDRYKLINDTLGHAAGDEVLVEVADRLRRTVGERDVVGRMGGDEFVVLLTEPMTASAVERTARRVLAAIEQPFVLSGRAHHLSASIGVAIASSEAVDAARLVRDADAAMYRVKSAGRNGVQFSGCPDGARPSHA